MVKRTNTFGRTKAKPAPKQDKSTYENLKLPDTATSVDQATSKQNSKAEILAGSALPPVESKLARRGTKLDRKNDDSKNAPPADAHALPPSPIPPTIPLGDSKSAKTDAPLVRIPSRKEAKEIKKQMEQEDKKA